LILTVVEDVLDVVQESASHLVLFAQVENVSRGKAADPVSDHLVHFVPPLVALGHGLVPGILCKLGASHGCGKPLEHSVTRASDRDAAIVSAAIVTTRDNVHRVRTHWLANELGPK
jgi:hypothetical protein